MGKSSSTPQFSTGNVNINGVNRASTSMSNGNVSSAYNMGDIEKQIYDYAQNSFLSGMQNVNVFSPDVQRQMQNQVNAYTNQGLNSIDSMYTPLFNNLKTDMAKRFGNMDNSMFMDNLNGIEGNRAVSMSNLAQDILAKQNDLYNDELSRRYNYLNLLGDTQNTIDSRMLSLMGLASQNSTMGNNYNMTAAQMNQKSPGLLDTLGGIASAASPYAKLGLEAYKYMQR